MKKNIINIRYITCIVNLQNTSAFQYLNLKQAIVTNLPPTNGLTYEEYSFENRYLIFHIAPNAVGKKFTVEIRTIMQNAKIDFVIIDELFPLDNSLILEKKEVPVTAKWITNTHFSKLESFIEVI